MSDSTDQMLRNSLIDLGVDPEKLEESVKIYFQKHGCMHCQIKNEPHYRFALCLECYRKFTTRMESIEE